MDRRKKINLIKQVAAGKFEALQELKELKLKSLERHPFEGLFLPCFYYLIDKGRICKGIKIPDSPEISVSDVKILKEGLRQLKVDGHYKNVTDRFLYLIIEVRHSLETLSNQSQLNLLDHYKKRSDIN